MAPSDKDGGQNMVSNLPLLFAAGYPTSLNKITEAQLEKFIPFMVQCSTGCLQNSHLAEPEWWPNDIEFTNPFKKAKSFRGVCLCLELLIFGKVSISISFRIGWRK
jgi:hypothetical protein